MYLHLLSLLFRCQTELDRTAGDFRKLHSDQRRFIKRLEETVDHMRMQDSQIQHSIQVNDLYDFCCCLTCVLHWLCKSQAAVDPEFKSGSRLLRHLYRSTSTDCIINIVGITLQSQNFCSYYCKELLAGYLDYWHQISLVIFSCFFCFNAISKQWMPKEWLEKLKNVGGRRNAFIKCKLTVTLQSSRKLMSL